MEKAVLWKQDDKYTNYRIPGLIVTKKGTVITYCEARRSVSDWASMDILAKRSTDSGKTFSEPSALARGTSDIPTVNNPVMVQDKKGRIHFLYCEHYGLKKGGRIFRRFSDDDGLTWSRRFDITASTLPDYRNAFALGPGHGICLSDGTLIIPVWMVPKHHGVPETRHSPSVTSTLYSKDSGKTWQIGELLESNDRVISPNETVAAETSDGRVYMNIRHGCTTRVQAYSDNGFLRWHDYGPVPELSDPQCFGSVISYDDGRNPYSLIFGNCACRTARKNVTVRRSTDDGRTWSEGLVLEKDIGGYVELGADTARSVIYAVYEENFGTSDYLAVIGYQEIK